MFPWLWLWAPQTHFPLSGSVAQHIEPKTFFDAIPPAAGDGRIEQRVFGEVATYGRQIGLLTEALLDLTEHGAPASAEGATAIRRLQEIRQAVERIKEEETARDAERIAEQLVALKVRNPEGFRRIGRQLRAMLDETSDP
ncbi:MAG: hypothetical protein OSW77_09295 [Proteobacteria bacterium]|jgi:hypothetical protein|nr:hypothetical protein [Pseudomonadota bacterium]